MSEYQARKARAFEIQREKEEAVKRELAIKAERDKQLAKAEEERRKQLDAASKEARRKELMRANEELIKKQQMEKNKKDEQEAMDYNPFAEDVRPGPGLAPISTKSSVRPTINRPTPSISKASTKPSTRPAGSSSSSGLHTKDKSQRSYKQGSGDKGSPPPLSRKEKAARALAAQAKKSAGDDLFSIRALVESRESGSTSPSPSSLSKTSVGNTGKAGNGNGNGYGYGQGPMAGFSKPGSNTGKNGSYSSLTKPIKGSARDFVTSKKSTAGLGEMRKLCPDRNTRDRRSIDDIARDLRAKKGLASDGSSEKIGSTSLQTTKVGMSSLKVGHAERDRGNIPFKQREKEIDRRIAPPPPSSSAQSPRKRRASPSTTSTSSSDYDSDGRNRPAKRRLERRSPPIKINERSSQAAVSAEIQALFRRPGQPQVYKRDVYSDDESDMEAGLSDVEQEEQRAARIARKEDELAEREERERKAKKEAMKKKLKMQGRG